VALISNKIGQIIDLTETELRRLKTSALLHDIGKTKIPHCILHKPEQLNGKEWDAIKEHPIHGEKLLIRLPIDAEVIQAVRCHHEKYNGKGYPDGLSGKDIPLYARIIAIADALDAMINSRPYRQKPLSLDEAISELQIHSGIQFDPHIVNRILDIKSVTKINS
jgi:HD-GYP domain-containing protein (c-di-GMP phosphodiesterase class II)